MGIIDPSRVEAVFDDENKETSTVAYRNEVGKLVRTTVSRKEGDQIAKILLKKDKDADNLRQGLKPGPSKKLIQGGR